MDMTDDECKLISQYYYIPSELERMIIIKMAYGANYINNYHFKTLLNFNIS